MRARFYRHVSEGGWPFSTAAHGWPISDCTAEGLKAVLVLRNHPKIVEECTHIGNERLYKALEVLLDYEWALKPRPIGGKARGFAVDAPRPREHRRHRA